MREELSFYQKHLEELKEKDSFRSVKNIVQDGKYLYLNGKKLLNLSSNDYLGISANKNIEENFLLNYKGKIQNPSARLLSGTNKIFNELEDFISNFLNKEKAVLFNSGYHANVGIYSSLLDREDVVFIDKLNHASIIDGIRLSGAKIIPFEHTNYTDLEEKLKKYRFKFKKSIISSETLFSMDGDFADTDKLIELKNKYNSILITDAAHSFGVYGGGTGFIKNTDEIDLIMGTFGKAAGSYGAFAAGNKVLINYLINCARSFIFSTALPEISVAYTKYVLENHILKGNLQEKLFDITSYAHKKLKGLNILGASYIIPVILGENKAAVDLSDKLIENGFYILPIRYPTVKKNEARIRISLNPEITKEEIDRLSDFIKN